MTQFAIVCNHVQRPDQRGASVAHSAWGTVLDFPPKNDDESRHGIGGNQGPALAERLPQLIDAITGFVNKTRRVSMSPEAIGQLGEPAPNGVLGKKTPAEPLARQKILATGLTAAYQRYGRMGDLDTHVDLRLMHLVAIHSDNKYGRCALTNGQISLALAAPVETIRKRLVSLVKQGLLCREVRMTTGETTAYWLAIDPVLLGHSPRQLYAAFYQSEGGGGVVDGQPGGVVDCQPGGVVDGQPHNKSSLTKASKEERADDDGVADAQKVSAPTKGPNSQGAPSGSKKAARAAADATQPQPEMALGDMWFTGQHLRIPNATFETWHRDYEGYSDRADIVRGAAAACDAKCASGNMNKTFGSALDWFEANWLPNARTQITAALAKIAAAASVNKGPAKKNAWDGLDPDDFGDPEPRR